MYLAKPATNKLSTLQNTHVTSRVHLHVAHSKVALQQTYFLTSLFTVAGFFGGLSFSSASFCIFFCLALMWLMKGLGHNGHMDHWSGTIIESSVNVKMTNLNGFRCSRSLAIHAQIFHSHARFYLSKVFPLCWAPSCARVVRFNALVHLGSG